LSDAPIAGAQVILLDESNDVQAISITDSVGVFGFNVSGGRYRLIASAAGYTESGTPELPFDEARTYPVEFLLDPAPVPIEGFEVETQAYERDLQLLGVTREDLGRRLVTRDAIAQRQSSRDVGEVLEWQALPGVSITRREQIADVVGGAVGVAAPSDTPELCVTLSRATRFDGARECATWVLDGRVTTDDILKLIAPEDVEAIVVLSPPEATLLFGTGNYGGAVAVYTRRGGR
jgi:hypothetical protein